MRRRILTALLPSILVIACGSDRSASSPTSSGTSGGPPAPTDTAGNPAGPGGGPIPSTVPSVGTVDLALVADKGILVAGTLDPESGGPAVRPYINPDLFQSSTDRTWPGKPIGDRTTWRRSLYVFSKRSIRYPMFEAFDQPDMVQSCARRNQSTVAPQALLLMNNDEIMLQAKFFAQRLIDEAGPDIGARVDRAYELALARPPRDSERQQAIEFIAGSPFGLVDFCQTIFNLNEFVYRQ